jgi:hypothetical protein
MFTSQSQLVSPGRDWMGVSNAARSLLAGGFMVAATWPLLLIPRACQTSYRVASGASTESNAII